jgi:hypothetical protein
MSVDSLDPAINIFSSGISGMAKFAWVLIPLVVIFGVIGIVWWIHKIRTKKEQWTHVLKVRRVLSDNRLTDTYIINMRRFPLVKGAEVFELEKSLLGCYLLPALDTYTGHNEYSIIIDTNNRIYTNKGEFFNPDKSCANVSATHAEVDITISTLRAKFQNINKVNKRLEWSQIAKYAFMVVGMICLTIMGIVAIQKWGEVHESEAQEAQATAAAMKDLGTAMTTIDATVNTQSLMMPVIKEIIGTNNLRRLINNKSNIND